MTVANALPPPWDTIGEIAGIVASVFTIAASGLALGVFFANRKWVSEALQILFAYTYQLTLSELTEKLDRLNLYHADDPEGEAEIRMIFHEIVGQVRGNSDISSKLGGLVNRIEKMASKKVKETHKRAMIAEMREKIRTMQVEVKIQKRGKK